MDQLARTHDADFVRRVAARIRGLTPKLRPNPDLADELSNLGVIARTRGEMGVGRENLELAVIAGQAAVVACPRDHPHLAGHLSNLSYALRVYGELEQAIRVARQSIAVAHPGDPFLGRHLNNLGIALAEWLDETGQLDLHDEAIDVLRRSVAVTPETDPERPMYMANLARALVARAERTDSAADAEEAVAVLERAAAATPDDHPSLSRRRSERDRAAGVHERLAAGPEDRDAAIERLGAAFAELGDDDPERWIAGASLGGFLFRRFMEGRADPADLERAVETARAVVAATPNDDQDRARRLNSLGIALALSAERSGTPAELDEAIGLLRESVGTTAPNAPALSARLSNLALALNARFEQTGDLALSTEAIEQARRATSVPGEDSPANRYSNLSVIARARYGRTGADSDADEAVDAARLAVERTPPGDVHRPGRVSMLAQALAARGRPEDLDAAIELGREAAARKQPGEYFWQDVMNNLGVVLRQRGESDGRIADLDEALVVLRASIGATDEQEATLAGRLANLSWTLYTRFKLAGDRSDLVEAIEVSRRAAGLSAAPPQVRTDVASRWANWAAEDGDWALAADGFEALLRLLSQAASRGLARADQEEQLTGRGMPAADAAACCLHLGDPERAVTLWEEGRGVLLAQALDARTDLTELEQRWPSDAARFAHLRDLLEQLPPQDSDGRRAAALELDEVIAAIRARAGFERFLLPPSVAELLPPDDETVAVVNVSDIRSDALLLTRDGVTAVPLAGVTADEVHDNAIAFLVASIERDEAKLREVLAWVWKCVARPVLDHVRSERLWWCASGDLGLLPLHAAGRHETRFEAEPETVLDRVISSYTPTLRALVHARGPLDAGASRTVVVAMPQTPGAADLPGARAEAALLPGALVLEGRAATRQRVLAELPNARRAHFACHGVSPLSDPAAGRLVLYDHATEPLTVLDVMRLRLERAELAFLSSCETGRAGIRLPDEATHLASAFQLAGFRHVIATLWPIGDAAAVSVAEEVYSALAEGAHPAAALHRAVHLLRARAGDHPLLWASHIHCGA